MLLLAFFSLLFFGSSNRCVMVLYYWIFLINVPLRTNDVEQLFKCLFAIHVSSLIKHMFKLFVYYLFIIGFLEFLVYSEYTFFSRYVIYEYFSVICPFILLTASSESFLILMIIKYIFSLLCVMLLVLHLRHFVIRIFTNFYLLVLLKYIWWLRIVNICSTIWGLICVIYLLCMY